MSNDSDYLLFDHHSKIVAERSLEIFREMRDNCPIADSAMYGGFKILSRYRDVVAAAEEWKTFSSENDLEGTRTGGKGIMIPPNLVRVGLVEMDPPQSLEYRKALTPLFSQTAMAKYRPRMQEIVTHCIDGFIERGSADFIHDLAIPVATLATLDFVGLPLERADYYGDMMHRVVFTDKESAEYPALVESLKELFAELRVLVVQRRAKPQNDVISSLIEATVAGRKFDDGEIAELSYVLLNGGVDTSTSLSAQILLYLQRNPAEKALVLADRKLLQSAIEEWLRFFTPSLGTSRTVTTERTLSGCPLHRGDRVWLALASANRDSEEFAQPDDVILDRHPNRHVAFGWGVHRCIGMHFARQEMELIVREVCKRLPDYHIDEAAIVPYTDIGIIQGVDRMPARFTPGSVSPR